MIIPEKVKWKFFKWDKNTVLCQLENLLPEGLSHFDDSSRNPYLS